jgi:hypothetical protein
MVIRPATILGIHSLALMSLSTHQLVYPTSWAQATNGQRRIKDRKGGENIRRTIANMSNIKVKDKR